MKLKEEKLFNYTNVGKNCDIHSTAIIDKNAIIGNNVTIGAYCNIGGEVVIGDNCILKSHVVVDGKTTIGNNNKIFSFAVIGQEPQDLKFHGEKSEILIGNNNSIREHVTIHPGTEADNMITKVGNDNLFMVGVHIAHDCIVGNRCIFANNVGLAGHVKVSDFVVIGGFAAIHAKVRIGEGVMVGGMSGVEFDIMPFGLVMGNRASLDGLNIIGMKRRNIDREDIHNMRHFFEELFENKDISLLDRAKELSTKYKKSKLVSKVIDFFEGETKRQFCTPRGK